MDLLRSHVTLASGSFGGLFGSLGVISNIFSCNNCTLSSKAISIALLILSWSMLILAIIIRLYQLKATNDHHFLQIMENWWQIAHHKTLKTHPWSCLKHLLSVKNQASLCVLSGCILSAGLHISCNFALLTTKGTWYLYRCLVLAMLSRLLKLCFLSRFLGKHQLSCWNRF